MPLRSVADPAPASQDGSSSPTGEPGGLKYRRISKKIIGRIPPEFRKKYRPGVWRTSVCAGATAADMGTQFSEGYPQGGLVPGLVTRWATDAMLVLTWRYQVSGWDYPGARHHPICPITGQAGATSDSRYRCRGGSC